MPKFIVKISESWEIEAESEEDARAKFFAEEVEKPQSTAETFIDEIINIEFHLKPAAEVASADEAREIAKDWQRYAGTVDLSYGELAEVGAYFEELARKFDLVEEFKENAII